MCARVFEFHQQRRIDLTASCRDADAIPKVDEAGAVIERDGVRVQIMHNGVAIVEDCYYGAWMTEIIRRLRGHHEPQEEAAFHLVVERLRADPPAAPVMVELGSFWAYYSLWFAHDLPGAQLVLVEPDPAHLEVGRRNAALNGVSASLINAAVGLPDGTIAAIACESDGIERSLQLVSVDGLMAREGLDHIDLLLCDTQGAELEMLEGARGALEAGLIRCLVISTHHHSICGDRQIHERCLSSLKALGAHVIAEHAVAESFSGDGLIVASMDPRDRDLALELSRADPRDSLFGEDEPTAAVSPTLSICIPTHHGRCALLEEALESIASQVTAELAPSIEIVVSDNASQDGTEAMIERFRARHPQLAVVYGRNVRDVRLQNITRVVERASGDWCWLFGSDDVMAEDGLRIISGVIERHPDATGIGCAKLNFSHDLTARLGPDSPASFPAATELTVYTQFDAVVRELGFQHAFLGTNIVRREHWLAAAQSVGSDVALRHPDWPQLLVLAEMARRAPRWIWLPDVLVKARAGRPYLVEGDAGAPDLARMHATLVDGLRDVWPEIAGRDTALHRAMLRKSYAVAASDETVRNIKLQPGQTLARDLTLLCSFTRAFWCLPEFRRRCLPALLVPAPVGRLARRLRSRRASTARLAPD